MASGFGITGKKGRCYDVWMDFSDCMSHCTMPAECTSRRDDYFECLHHRKEGIEGAVLAWGPRDSEEKEPAIRRLPAYFGNFLGSMQDCQGIFTNGWAHSAQALRAYYCFTDPASSVELITLYSRMNAINKEKERQAFGDLKEKSHDSSGH